MELSPQHKSHYWEKGWVVVEGVFPPDVVERVAQLALRLAEEDVKPGAAPVLVDKSPDGTTLAPRKLGCPFLKDPAFGKLIFNSPLPDLIEQLIGVTPLLCTDQIFFKPPHHGSPKPYHQDNDYFRVTPDDHVVTAWIAMDDVDESNGCLRYIDGSHKGPILPSRAVPGKEYDLTPDPALIDLSKESPARVKKGGVVFHHGKALHCSGANTSNRWRRGYATHWVTAAATCEGNVIAKAYFQQPELFEGLNARGNVRKTRKR